MRLCWVPGYPAHLVGGTNSSFVPQDVTEKTDVVRTGSRARLVEKFSGCFQVRKSDQPRDTGVSLFLKVPRIQDGHWLDSMSQGPSAEALCWLAGYAVPRIGIVPIRRYTKDETGSSLVFRASGWFRDPQWCFCSSFQFGWMRAHFNNPHFL